MKEKFLSRDGFREAVFKRDSHLCVVCKNEAKDAHHIVERKLWEDGGYYLSNGVSLCNSCHLKAEMTTISCEELRKLAGISKIIMPTRFEEDESIDKWGNQILPNGNRIRGELFDDPSVQKILSEGNVLRLFSYYIKYPRTPHLMFSEGASNDDKILKNHDNFNNKNVIVSYKLDGENTSLYSDHFHARSLNSKNHPSRNWIRNFHSQIKNDIPEGWRICGENLFAKHTINYTNLDSYFYGYSIWNDKNVCLSWEETLEYFEILGIHPVPTFYEGIWNEKLIKETYPKTFRGDPSEGFVVRLKDSFSYKDFNKSCAKFVSLEFRNNLENNPDSTHWSNKSVVPNKIKNMN